MSCDIRLNASIFTIRHLNYSDDSARGKRVGSVGAKIVYHLSSPLIFTYSNEDRADGQNAMMIR